MKNFEEIVKDYIISKELGSVASVIIWGFFR